MSSPRRRIVAAPARRPRARLLSVHILVLPDEDPDTSYLDQDDPDFSDRREAYLRGDFGFVGVRAEAKVAIESVVQTLTSGGLWGIESDSGDDYIREIAGEEWHALRDILLSVGVPTSELPKEVEARWIEWRV